ncbi:MAG: hypothetical protein LBV31_01870 [Prevotellaceae bacterium]|nr:hypothetical protein [Prevotellaceae bacterium]
MRPKENAQTRPLPVRQDKKQEVQVLPFRQWRCGAFYRRSLTYGYENQGFQPILAYFIEIKPKQLYHILMR